MAKPSARQPPAPVERYAVTRQRGFGLLEAIVALALLAGTGLALLSWIQQSLQIATRMRVTEQQARLLLSAQAMVELLNPAEQPEGSWQSNGLTLAWQSQPVEPPRRNSMFVAGILGPWQVGLYRLAVQARDDASAVSVTFVQFRTGLKRLTKEEGSP
jgi:general secretion pathway protein I